MIKSKVTRVIVIENGYEVFVWLENGKLLSCNKDDNKEFELAFQVKVGDVVCYEEKADSKILVKSINS